MEPTTLLGQYGKPRFSEGLWSSRKNMDFWRLFFGMSLTFARDFLGDYNFNATAKLWSRDD